MAKTHALTWRGLAGTALIGSIVLSSAVVAKEKINDATDIAKEILCAGQELAGGLVNSDLIDCTGRGQTTTAVDPSETGD